MSEYCEIHVLPSNKEPSSFEKLVVYHDFAIYRKLLGSNLRWFAICCYFFPAKRIHYFVQFVRNDCLEEKYRSKRKTGF